jgi:hypothetical protein
MQQPGHESGHAGLTRRAAAAAAAAAAGADALRATDISTTLRSAHAAQSGNDCLYM